jgi:hypothetical protein
VGFGGPRFDLGFGGGRADALMREAIELMNEMADAAEKGDKKRVAALEARMREFDARFKELNLSREEQVKLQEKWRPEIERAFKRYLEASTKAGSIDKTKPEKDKDVRKDEKKDEARPTDRKRD